MTRLRLSGTPIERLMARIVNEAGALDTECWIPTYSAHTAGYRRMTDSGRPIYCHRLAYEHFVGPIPDGMQIDHLCRNRACCNPSHLEPVTNRENSLRGVNPMVVIHRTGICSKGHEMEMRNGRRYCRTCVREASTRGSRRAGHKPRVPHGTLRCTVDGCDNAAHARLLCVHHYNVAYAAKRVTDYPLLRDVS